MNQSGKPLTIDPIVAEAFFGSSSRKGPVSAERELMIAVLSDAIECFWKYRKSRAALAIRLYQEAKAWLFADTENHPFSFLNICQTLGLEPSYIRRGILTGAESTPPVNTQSLAGAELARPPQYQTQIEERAGMERRRAAIAPKSAAAARAPVWL